MSKSFTPTGKSTGISTRPSDPVLPVTFVPFGNVIIISASDNGFLLSSSVRFTRILVFPNVVFVAFAVISARRPTISTFVRFNLVSSSASVLLSR